MKFSVNKEVQILSLSFLLIFLGFNAVQHYVTAFFSESGLIGLGFQSLILIYFFIVLFTPVAAILVSKYGAKKCMIFASIFYSFFIISLLSKSPYLVYLASILLGIAGSLLWIGQNSFLIRASDKKSYGENSGFFNSLQLLGSMCGVLLFGLLVGRFFFKIPFLFFSLFPLIGLLLFFGLRDLKIEQKLDYLRLLKKSISSLTALRLSSLWFAVNFVFGLTIGIIPIEIKNVLGLSYIGILISLFYILPILFSYFSGKLSDIKGRKKMIILSYILLIIGLLSFYISGRPIFLISGIALIALNWTIAKPVTYALVGDVSTKQNLEFLTALFFMVANIGIISALFISQIFASTPKVAYLISIFVVVTSLIIILPLLRLRIEKLREILSQEVS